MVASFYLEDLLASLGFLSLVLVGGPGFLFGWSPEVAVSLLRVRLKPEVRSDHKSRQSQPTGFEVIHS